MTYQNPFAGILGSVTIGAPLITKSGLIFIGASMDAQVQAIDLKSGDVLWQA